MASFASCRRTGCVRFLVLLLCALFIFGTLAAPAARAEALTLGLFTAAAVLSAATAALGFKLSSTEQGQATLAKMVQDFKASSLAVGLVLTGNKVNGLINGVDYIKTQVKAGKTFIDERVIAWVQQWLGQQGVYDQGSFVLNDYSSMEGKYIGFPNKDISYYIGFFPPDGQKKLNAIISHYNLNLSGRIVSLSYNTKSGIAILTYSVRLWDYYENLGCKFRVFFDGTYSEYAASYDSSSGAPSIINAGSYQCSGDGSNFDGRNYGYGLSTNLWLNFWFDNSDGVYRISNVCDGTISANDTGISGTDTIGKDVIDLSLDQILAKLKDWAADWFDAGADSATNSATGAIDLPLTVPAGAATQNPALNPDVVYNPPFAGTLDDVRGGTTAQDTQDTGVKNMETATAAPDVPVVDTDTVEGTQSVINSLVDWALEYISPDKGLFSKFPLCIPYDAYLLVCSALGVDALGVDEVVSSSPGDIQSVMGSSVEIYSDFQPVINIDHQLTAGGTTYPIKFTIDLSPFEPVVKLNRIFVSVYVLAELIASEYKRIRES